MATPPEKADPLQPVLEDVEAELRRRLQEACASEVTGISTDSTASIRRLEDSLLAAAVAAEQTIALRRRMGQADAPTNRPQEPAATDAHPEEPGTTLREFRDKSGRAWRAWSVTPGLARPGRSTERFLGAFHQGWVCFEALDSSARRRLPCERARWASSSEEDLERMLEEAISAPERKPSPRESAPDKSESQRSS